MMDFLHVCALVAAGLLAYLIRALLKAEEL